MKPPAVGLPYDDDVDWQRAQDFLSDLEKAWRDGSHMALSETVKFCDAKQQILPPWAAAAVLGLLALDPKKRNRRLSGWRRTDHANAVHRIRYDVVSTLARTRRMTWEKAFDEAHRLLVGTEARGTPAMMRRSYHLVEKHVRAGAGWRFYLHG